MAVPSALRANYSDLFGSAMLPVLEEMFWSEYNQSPLQREMLFKTVSHDRDIWQYSEMHDMPQFAAVSEGADYSFSRPKAGSNKTLTVLKYGLGYSISEEAISDGKFDLVADAIRKMGRSARESQEQAAMDILNNGFGSTTTADGLALFHAAHTTPTGTITIRNKLSSAADLSYTALQTAVQDFMKVFRGDSGNYYDVQPKFLVVHTDSVLYAKEVVGSQLKVDSEHNNLNSLQGMLQVVASPRLTDTDAWFIASAPSDNGLRIINRQSLETKAASPDSVGFMNDAVFYKARYREIIGAVNPIGLFGTPGA